MWSVRDAWILLAIASTRDGDLQSVIARADYINVDIPACDELRRIVGRLIAAGLVAEGPRGLVVRVSAFDLIKQSRGKDGIRMVPRRLQARLTDQVPFPEGAPDWDLAPADWQRAYDDYRQAFR